MSWLLDGNVLVALTIDSHVHHRAARRWFFAEPRRFATCPITQGTLLRVHMTMALDKSAEAAWRTLAAITALDSHELWDGGLSYDQVPHRHLQGPKQVTDAWLAELARRNNGRLATLDSALVALHPDVAQSVLVQREP